MTTKFDELMLDPEFRKLYAVEALIADTSQLIADLLEQRNLKQADLARMLNKTPAFVSQLLNGKPNLTLRTLAEVAFALGAKVVINADEEPEAKEEDTEPRDAHSCRTFRTHLTLEQTSVTFKMKTWERRELAESSGGKLYICREDVA